MKICVFGASGDELRQEYFDDAERLGELIADGGHTLVFGGGATGLMGAAARGAYRRGGELIGVAPTFFNEPDVLYEHCTSLIFTETMSQRKSAMEDAADAFVILPGGIGTLEEFFETLTLKQLGRHSKPMALLNTLGYYDALTALLEGAVEGGFLGGSCLSLFALCATPEQALAHSASAEQPRDGSRGLRDYNK